MNALRNALDAAVLLPFCLAVLVALSFSLSAYLLFRKLKLWHLRRARRIRNRDLYRFSMHRYTGTQSHNQPRRW